MSTRLTFSHAFAASQYPHLFAVRAYDTPEQGRAWSNGDRARLNDLNEWLDDTPIHGVLADRQEGRSYYLVALEDDADAVNFKLRWSDHLIL